MRKQLVIIAMAVLALLTAQCKKNEPKPGEKVMVPITGTVDFGGSKTEITTTGCITPVVGDKIYIYSNSQNVGYVNCTATSGQQFSCSGEIEENCLGTTCTFMYLGSGSTDAGGDPIDGNSTTISFADQTSVSVSNGKIANMNKFHVGSCTAAVSQEGTVTLSMLSKMAIAYFQLKDGSGSPIANKNVTISGLSATATINKTDGNITGSGTGNITVHTDANGSFYMALIPQSGPVEFAFIFAGYEGTRTFSNGIRECNFYSEQGLGSPLQVTLEPPKFSVASGKTVGFAPGNLYYDNSDNTCHWKFEENQWDFRTYNGNGSCINGSYNASGGTPSGDWGLFGWSTTASKNYNGRHTRMEPATGDYYDYVGGSFKDWGTISGLPSAGDGKTWYTLSKDEWSYLIGKSSPGRNESLCKFSKVTFNASGLAVSGFIIMPDGYDYNTTPLTDGNGTTSYSRWQTLEAAGAVFLPAAGYRFGTTVNSTGGGCNYWTSTMDSGNSNNAWRVYFAGSNTISSDFRRTGGCVRLVRDL